MSRHQQIYKQRLYEGEHVFACGLCGGTFVQYSFGAEPNEFYDRQQPPPCLACGTCMEWAGWSGQSDVTGGLAGLLEDGHYMAATVLLAAFVEYQLSALLWGILVDSGLSRENATFVANGRLPRSEVVRMVRDLLGRRVKDLAFPMRNEVAHGKAFGLADDAFVPALEQQLLAIKDWVASVSEGRTPSGYSYTELDRWTLSMQHWASWMLNWWNAHRAARRLKSVPDQP